MKLRWLTCFSIIELTTALCLMTLDLHGLVLSVKSLGMAATGVAYPQDSLSGGFNPAGTTEVPDRFDLGFTWARDRQRTKIHGNLIPTIDGSFDGARKKNACSPEFGLIKHVGRVTNRGYNYSQGIGATVGFLWDVTPGFKIGATYQPETHMTRFRRYTGFLSQRGALNIPPQEFLTDFSLALPSLLTLNTSPGLISEPLKIL